MLKKSSEKFKQLHKQEIYTTIYIRVRAKGNITFRLEPFIFATLTSDNQRFSSVIAPFHVAERQKMKVFIAFVLPFARHAVILHAEQKSQHYHNDDS